MSDPDRAETEREGECTNACLESLSFCLPRQYLLWYAAQKGVES